MTNILVTHADEPIGRRVIKQLFHDEEVGTILAIGDGPPPRAFDRFLAGHEPRLSYARVDLAKHRPVSDLFHSSRFRGAEIDAVVHIPRHGAPALDDHDLTHGPTLLAQRNPARKLGAKQCVPLRYETRAWSGGESQAPPRRMRSPVPDSGPGGLRSGA